MFEAKILPDDTRDLSAELNDAYGRPRVRDAAFYRDSTTQNERSAYCVRSGSYCLPTTELVGFLRYVIGGRKAIEIGAGNGALAASLDIQATDSFQQIDPDVVAYYALLRSQTVRYGRNVDRVDALAAIAKYRPRVVVSAWVTHLYDPANSENGGNDQGIDEAKVIESCETYLMVGNRHVHRNKPIWALPHKVIEPDWLYSRAFNGTPDFIACWGNSERFA